MQRHLEGHETLKKRNEVLSLWWNYDCSYFFAIYCTSQIFSKKQVFFTFTIREGKNKVKNWRTCVKLKMINSIIYFSFGIHL